MEYSEIVKYLNDVKKYIATNHDICRHLYIYGDIEEENGHKTNIYNYMSNRLEAGYLRQYSDNSYLTIMLGKYVRELESIVNELEREMRSANNQLELANSIKEENDDRIDTLGIVGDLIDARRQLNFEYESSRQDETFKSIFRGLLTKYNSFIEMYKNNKQTNKSYVDSTDEELYDALTKTYTIDELVSEGYNIDLDRNAITSHHLDPKKYERVNELVNKINYELKGTQLSIDKRLFYIGKEVMHLRGDSRIKINSFCSDRAYHLYCYSTSPSMPRIDNNHSVVDAINDKFSSASEIERKSNHDLSCAKKRVLLSKMQLMRRLHRSDKSSVKCDKTLAGRFDSEIKKLTRCENSDVNKNQLYKSIKRTDDYLDYRSSKMNSKLERDLLLQSIIRTKNEIIQKGKEKTRSLKNGVIDFFKN